MERYKPYGIERKRKDEGLVLGIDPGAVAGGCAILNGHGKIVMTSDLPTSGVGTKLIISAPLFVLFVREYMPLTRAVVEKVGSMPGQGVASTFKFGRGVGVIEGSLGALSVSVSYVHPRVWKKYYGLSSDKEDSRQRAIELWPESADMFKRKKDHGRAEAALIARWWQLAGG